MHESTAVQNVSLKGAQDVRTAQHRGTSPPPPVVTHPLAALTPPPLSSARAGLPGWLRSSPRRAGGRRGRRRARTLALRRVRGGQVPALVVGGRVEVGGRGIRNPLVRGGAEAPAQALGVSRSWACS